MQLLLLVLALCGGLAAAAPQGSYSTKYDSVDLDEILRNDRLYKVYHECLLDKGKCPPEGKELRDVLPEALTTKCAKCTEKQKERAEKTVKYLIENRPKEYAELEKKFDPQGSYRKLYKP